MADTEQFKIDSSQARADLAAFEKSLNQAGAAAKKLDSNLTSAMAGASTAVNKGLQSMKRFAQVSALLSKIKFAGNPAGQIRQFADSLNALGRAKTFDATKLAALRDFIKILPNIRVPTGAQRMTQFLNAIGSARAPSSTTITRLQELMTVVQGWRGTGAPKSAQALDQFFNTIGRLRTPSATSIARLEQMFKVLGTAKPIPNANAIARDLDHIAASASRAAIAMGAMPARVRGVGGAMSSAGAGAQKLNQHMKDTPTHAANAHRGIVTFGGGLDNLTTRFKLSYQAGTLFSALFASFTFGQFVKGVVDTNIQFQKLEKAMLFVTSSFDGAHKASAEYLAMSDKLGMRALANSDAYGRFAISSKAIGATQADVNKIFYSTGLALTAIGASAQGWEYSFYGLSQAMAKGKVTSEEFNRQIGEQIPGNVSAGVKALSRLTGRAESVNSLFGAMKAGTIQSLPFFKLWAEEIEKMFAPLLPVAEKRPDFQMNRLLNVFDRFKLAVGNSGFVGALTGEFKKLADTFIVGSGNAAHLNEKGQALATTFGHGLSDVVHKLGEGIQFLVTHLDDVVAVMKGFLALSVASTLAEWGKAAGLYTDKIVKAGIATISTANATRAANKANAGAYSATLSRNAGGAAATMVTGLGGVQRNVRSVPGATKFASKGVYSYESLRGQGYSHADAEFYANRSAGSQTAFWKRGDVGSNMATAAAGGFGRRAPYNPAGAATGGAGGVNMSGFAQALQMTAMASDVGSSALKGLRTAINFLPGIAMAAGIALAIFGDKMTGLKTKAGAAVNFNDVASGIGGTAGKGVIDWLNGIATSFALLTGTANQNGGGKSLAEWLAAIAASLIGFTRIIVTLADTVGKIVGLLIRDLFELGHALGLAATGQFGKAKDLLGDLGGYNARMFKEIGKNFASAFDFKSIYESILGGMEKAANDRSSRTGSNDKASREASAADLTIEAALKQREAADAQMKAAADLAAAARDFKGEVAPDYASIRNDIVSLMQGKSTAWDSINGRAGMGGAGAGAPAGRTWASVKASQAEPAAAPAVAAGAGGTHDAAFMNSFVSSIIKAESSGRAGVAGPPTPYGTAHGLMQMLDPTAAAVARQHGIAFDPAMMRDTSDAGASYQRRLGALHIQDLTKKYDGDLEKVALAYHGGTNTSLWGPKTFTYAREVLGRVGMPLSGTAPGMDRKDVQEALAKAGYKPGEGGGGTGSALMTTPSDEAGFESHLQRRSNSFKQFQGLLAEADPATAAQSVMNEKLITLKKIVQAENDLRKASASGGVAFQTFFTDEDLKTLDKAVKNLQQDYEDALNPLGKMNRLAEASLKVTALQAKGLIDEGEWQGKLNDLIEQHVDLTKIDLEKEHQRFVAGQVRARQLQDQIDLTKTLNEITVDQIKQEDTRRATTFATLVQGQTAPGESYQDALARLEKEHRLGGINTQANAIEANQRHNAEKTQGDAVTEMLAQKGMNGDERTRRADFKAALEQISGISAPLEELLTKTDKGMQELAHRAADVKYQFENPPGFQKWVEGLEPFAKRMENIKTQFVEDLSNGITDGLMGDKVDWTSIIKNARRSLMKSFVDEQLKGVLGRFGIGQKAATPEAQALVSAADQHKVAAEMLQQAATSITAAFTTAQQQAGAATGTGVPGLGTGTGIGGSSLLGANDNNPLSAIGAGGMSGALDAFGGSTSGGTHNWNALSTALGGGDRSPISLEAPMQLSTAGADMSGFSMPDMSALSGLTGGGAGAGGGGLMGGLGSMFSSLFGGGAGGAGGAAGAGGGLGGIMSSLFGGKSGGLGAGLLAGLLGALGGHKHNKLPLPGMDVVHGIIGEMRPITTTGKEIAGHGNPIADILNLALSAFTGGFGQGGGMSMGATMGNMGSSMSSNLGKFMGMFSEGGYSEHPVSKMLMGRGMHDVPHYSDGTHNTSGIPAILHPNEAVIPLSRGRKIPVEMNDNGRGSGGGGITLSPTFNIMTPDANSFRQSQGAITKKASRDLRRAANRNLTAQN